VNFSHASQRVTLSIWMEVFLPRILLLLLSNVLFPEVLIGERFLSPDDQRFFIPPIPLPVAAARRAPSWIVFQSRPSPFSGKGV